MSATAKKLKRHTWEKRERAGRYRKSPTCDGCGKPAGTAWFTDEEVCGGSDGPGFYLCDRSACVARRDGLAVEQRRALYESTRTATEQPATRAS